VEEWRRTVAHLQRHPPAFLSGKTPSGFAPDNFDVEFKPRGTEADLNGLGRSQHFRLTKLETLSSYNQSVYGKRETEGRPLAWHA
jgi:hypothetical protein